MKIGVLGCAFECAEALKETFEPWKQAKQSKLSGHEFIISVSSIQFKEYADLNYVPNNSDTLLELEMLNSEGVVDFYYSSRDPYDEASARNLALNPLIAKGCDVIWIWDCSDEFYTIPEIRNICKFVENNPFGDWFEINFRNYIFDGKRHVKGFCPPRIFRTEAGGWKLSRFYWDNDVYYKRGDKETSYKAFASHTVPPNLAEIKHLTWLHSNGRKKYEYQMKHFGNCSYKWNYDTNQLEFNKDYYINRPMPTVYED